MKTITQSQHEYLAEAAERLRCARKVVALTGAGISVESGIDDFRSPGGLWSHYPPEEYATIEAFRRNPEKSWKLYRALGKGLVGKRPNTAHHVLTDLENTGTVQGVVTQNVDNLHQDSGSRVVLEIHGNHRHLQCLGCGDVSLPSRDIFEGDKVPMCRHCRLPLKPNVVLFGEPVRSLDEIQSLVHRCDALLVIGTSAQVYPAAALPEQIKETGGLIFEFNISETVLTRGDNRSGVSSDYFFQGSASVMLELLQQQCSNMESDN
jgi:NAD-dependent deacetylase